MVRVSGAVIIRNGVKYGYPFIESIRSILPLCDEVVIAVGDSEDGTRDKIGALNDHRIRIIDTVWDMTQRTGGTVLSEQTNIALRACTGDWIFYIQSDEAAHEQDFENMRAAMDAADNNAAVDGLFFEYVHLYGSYFTEQVARNWYAREVRLIKNRRGIVSHGDAQGFRVNGEKIVAAPAHGRIFHYGWARPPEVMAQKVKSFHALWHDDQWIKDNCDGKELEAYFSDLGNLVEYRGTHPAVMAGLINRDAVAFIMSLRQRYLKQRSLRRLLKDYMRSLPLVRHSNFKKHG
ncbi:MAG: glycosyltransferase [Elusimicrobia bacterium]|nr:glycosyltransferase [Elusimicrobiota bacterium]